MTGAQANRKLAASVMSRQPALTFYGYVVESGRIVLEGPADELRSNEDVREFYLGLDREVFAR